MAFAYTRKFRNSQRQITVAAVIANGKSGSSILGLLVIRPPDFANNKVGAIDSSKV